MRLTHLPVDCLINILIHIHYNDLLSLSISCKLLNSLCNNKYIWRHKLKLNYPYNDYSLDEPKESFRQLIRDKDYQLIITFNVIDNYWGTAHNIEKICFLPNGIMLKFGHKLTIIDLTTSPKKYELDTESKLGSPLLYLTTDNNGIIHYNPDPIYKQRLNTENNTKTDRHLFMSNRHHYSKSRFYSQSMREFIFDYADYYVLYDAYIYLCEVFVSLDDVIKTCDEYPEIGRYLSTLRLR